MITLNSTEEFVARNEGCSLNAYLDPAGVPTIGYGTTILPDKTPVKMGMIITEDEANQYLAIKCGIIETQLNHMITMMLNQNQLGALVDFCYNLGLHAFLGSTLYRYIEMGSSITEDLFTRWDKIHRDGHLIEVNGLKERRLREFKLYVS